MVRTERLKAIAQEVRPGDHLKLACRLEAGGEAAHAAKQIEDRAQRRVRRTTARRHARAYGFCGSYIAFARDRLEGLQLFRVYTQNVSECLRRRISQWREAAF